MAVKHISGTGSRKLSIASLFAAVKSVVETGNEEAFIDACAEKRFNISARVALINFTKDFLEENDVVQPTGSRARSLAASPARRLSQRVRECDDPSECD